MKSLGRMFRPVAWKVSVSVLIGLVRISASLSFVWVCKLLVDIVTGKADLALEPYIFVMAGIMAIQILGSTCAAWWEGYVVLKARNSMRKDTFRHVMNSVWNGRESFHSGDIINRLEEDTRVVVDLICVRIPDIVVTICQLIAASIFLFTMAPNLLWLLILLMCIAIVGSRLFFKTLRRLTKEIRELDSSSQQHMQENFQRRVLVLTLIGTERVVNKLGWFQQEMEGKTKRRLNLSAIARTFMGLGFAGGYAAAFLWGIIGIKNGTVTFGMMTAFLQLVGQVQRPISDLARHVPAFIQALTSIERLEELTSLPLESTGEPVILDHCPEIRIEGIDFAYEGSDKKIFENFSYVFPAGTTTEIAGPTGIGKSTLIRLILGLLNPISGEITIDGTRVSASTRWNFMYVPQGNSLMSGTIRENLQLADEDATEDRMRSALHTAAADFVFELKDGLESRCGEIGSGLSEGQSQRIAIARALLCKGTVLILDEATSALDIATEEILLNNLKNECHGKKTVLFISHRESVARICDSIITL
ncbi:MAG: ABC transporter ATP-binding protein/permease [Bacteroidales bacterium]|nr:ABC transporter ATP-binding protein/permease [Bacteroidales bacterium]